MAARRDVREEGSFKEGFGSKKAEAGSTDESFRLLGKRQVA
jgi:hypothetical protein